MPFIYFPFSLVDEFFAYRTVLSKSHMFRIFMEKGEKKKGKHLLIFLGWVSEQGEDIIQEDHQSHHLSTEDLKSRWSYF